MTAASDTYYHPSHPQLTDTDARFVENRCFPKILSSGLTLLCAQCFEFNLRILLDMLSIKVEPEDTLIWDKKRNGGSDIKGRKTMSENAGYSVMTSVESLLPCLVEGSQNRFKREEASDPSEKIGMEDIPMKVTVHVDEDEFSGEKTENGCVVITRNDESDSEKEGCEVPHSTAHPLWPSGTLSSKATVPQSSLYALAPNDNQDSDLDYCSQPFQGHTSVRQINTAYELSCGTLQFPSETVVGITQHQCQFSWTSLQELDKEGANYSKSLKCILCGQSFSTAVECSKTEVIDANKEFVYHQSGKHLIDQRVLPYKDCEVTHNSDSKPFKCQFCKKSFRIKRNRKIHEMSHTGEKPYKCQYCEISFRERRSCKVHEMAHTGEKPFKCQFCGRFFNTKQNCKSHEITHMDEKPFKCQFCDRLFSRSRACKTHEMLHKGEKPFKCQYCEMSFIHKQVCKRHEMVHSGERPFKCQFCEMSFIQKNNCTKHEATHTGEKPFKCRFCEMSYCEKRYCKAHEMTHTGEKPFKCQFCEKLFSNKRTCQIHEMTHTGEKPFKCQYCEMSFRDKRYLKTHEMKHTGEKPFKCQFCEKLFKMKRTLKMHEMIHTGEKPFKCQICGLPFREKRNRKAHENTHFK
ncbi:hypothetical protein HOLleu_03773 [Holothuria leucospilota]|uniref:C2H2-type domain-containing protein n=1 Tax=Holothuria leucospilota TaxID=206669 RepID=A0A9Q1HKF1_HOLLE|nr:hypothetical protein HOLleu_03773 [Holothuria leucospilota]